MNEEARTHLERYRSEWSAVDDTLYALCAGDNRPHTSRPVVFAKVILIARAYSTQIERGIPLAPEDRMGSGSAITLLADWMCKSQQRVDALIAPLPAADAAPSAENLQVSCSAVHGLVKLLVEGLLLEQRDKVEQSGRRRPRNYSPVSFASKYLHFHAPCVPVYDSYAVNHAKDLRKRTEYADLVLECPTLTADYARYCRALWAASRTTGYEDLTVKELDAILLSTKWSS